MKIGIKGALSEKLTLHGIYLYILQPFTLGMTGCLQISCTSTQ